MNRLEQLQSLLNDLLAALQMIAESGEELEDNLQGVIANELNWLWNEIQREQTPIETKIPENLTEAMPSSNIGAFQYNDKDQKLYVQFLGKYPDREGPIYSYEGVPKQIFELFRSGAVPARTDGKNRWGKWWKGKVPSMGSSLYTLLKTAGYPYQRLTA